MDKKTIATSILVILGLFGVMWWGFKVQTTPTTQSSTRTIDGFLTTTEPLYDLGTISMKDGPVEHIFTLTNTSDADLSLREITTSCMCTTAYLEGEKGEQGPFGMEGMGYMLRTSEVIKAGESKKVKVVYDPNAHGPAGVGGIDRSVNITDTTGQTLTLEIKAVVTP